jgi:hypothetical protein
LGKALAQSFFRNMLDTLLRLFSCDVPKTSCWLRSLRTTF